MCGEKALSTFSSRKNSGSPPRMRGKVQPDADGCRPPGITPAYAGKRRAAKRYKRLLWDHPRVCGEKTAPRHRLHLAKGSPPRMRGKGRCRPPVPPVLGITPACAGKRWFVLFRCAIVWDHPRVCGEKHASACTARAALRSPPRVRGKAAAARAGLVAVGITPACAGKSLTIQKMTTRSRDHPRVCGEKKYRKGV